MGGERMRKRGDSSFLLQPSVMGEGSLSNRQVGAEEPRSRRACGIVPGMLRHSSHASRIALPMATQHMDSEQHCTGSGIWRCAVEAILLAFRGLCVMDLLIRPGQGHRPPRALLNQQSLGSRQRGSKPEMSKLEAKHQVYVLQN